MFSNYLKQRGIVGINARNLDYIFTRNNRKYYPFADSKLLTKKLADEVGVNTPKLIAEISWQYELRHLNDVLDQHKEFVIKPNHGSGGDGIIVVKDTLPVGFKKGSDDFISKQEIIFHCQNILGGMYSLGGQSDTIIIEDRVKFDPVFEEISFQGVPDVRIIVMEGKPIMGMLRLPTKKSDGKANLHLGGIGVGIDMKTGRTTHAVQSNTYIERHPETGHFFKDREVPMWDEMLAIAVKMQQASRLGYIGVDIVLDRERGPLVLEINARPGISIQIANNCGLREAIQKKTQKSLIIATGNPHKVNEFEQLLKGLPFEVLSAETCGGMPEVDETGATFAENAHLKASALRAIAPQDAWALADDSGLEVDALNGAPGVYSARYAGAQASDHDNIEKLLKALVDVPTEDRTARFKCVLCIIDPEGSVSYHEGSCEGRIAMQASGADGFGYDPVFIPEGYGKSFAELGNRVKSKLSHRARAVQAFNLAFDEPNPAQPEPKNIEL